VRVQFLQVERGWNDNGTQTDAGGNYSLQLAGPGTYQVMIDLGPDRGGPKLNVTIPADGGSDFQQDLVLPSAEIRGTVIDGETRRPVPRVEVAAFPGGSSGRSLPALIQSMAGHARTDDAGRFTLSSLPAGTYSIRAFAEGYPEGRSDNVSLEEGDVVQDVQVVLEKGIPYRVQVVDAGGQPLAQAMILVRDSAGDLVNFAHPARSNQDGIAELAGLRPGLYRITALHSAYAPSSITAQVAEGASEPTIAMRPGGGVQATVLNQKGRPVQGAVVDIVNEKNENVADDVLHLAMMTGQGGGPASVTGSSGTLSLGQVTPGTYRAVARLGKARSREEKLSVSEGQVSPVRLTLSE
jgi:protocatechuate 3,4-dioxygenase beta subunit